MRGDMISGVEAVRDFSGKAEAYRWMRTRVRLMQEEGYLTASIDSVVDGDSEVACWLYQGPMYRWARVTKVGIPVSVALQAGIDGSRLAGRRVRSWELARVCERMVVWAENHGYPFAKAGFAAAGVGEDGGVNGRFYLDLGPLIRIDSIYIQQSGFQVSLGFLYRSIDIFPGSVYDERKVRMAARRFREIPFIQESRPGTLTFQQGKAVLRYYLKERKAGYINALVGFLPNNVETGRLLLTADAQLRLQNALGRGERLDLTYQNLQYQSPRLVIQGSYPYLFGSGVGGDVRFNLFKKDTSFRITKVELGGTFRMSAWVDGRVFYINTSNRVITVDTQLVKARKVLPDVIDLTAQGLGGEVRFERTDVAANPGSGVSASATFGIWNRLVKRNDRITSLVDGSGFRYAGLYDSLGTGSAQVRFSGHVYVYLRVARQVVVKVGYDGGMVGGGRLFRNELYQIGGFRLLRGFDEQSVFTSTYHVGVLEGRVLLGERSYLSAFTDQGYVMNAVSGGVGGELYQGFGVGGSLETGNGVLTLGYAFGRRGGAAFQLRQSKVHIGFVTFF